jgi:uridine kinase
MAKIESVEKRSGAVVPFNQDRIANAIYRAAVAVGGRDRSTAEKLSNEVVRLLEERGTADRVPHIEEIQDLVEEVLIENGHAQVAKAYILYREERARRRDERARQNARMSENIPWQKIWRVLDWAVDHDLNTIDGLNNHIRAGDFSDVVISSEALYQEDLENAANLIMQRIRDVKMVIISGPSSSGKTTTTIKIGQRLARMDYKLVTLNVDHYFFDLEMHPIDEFGDYDFETPQALDLELINEHLQKLASGEVVLIPYYDFKTGRRLDSKTPMRLADHEILLIDSLHGLYPGMTEGISDERKFKLYLEPLLQMKDSDGEYIRWTDIRLMRRMLRDAAHRAYDPARTLEHWHYVRASELRNIIPYIHTSDYIINSAMPYELPIYKSKLFDYFAAWVNQYKGDPLREDAYTRALRVYEMLEQIEAVADDSVVPHESVIREFIGGSVYSY